MLPGRGRAQHVWPGKRAVSHSAARARSRRHSHHPNSHASTHIPLAPFRHVRDGPIIRWGLYVGRAMSGQKRNECRIAANGPSRRCPGLLQECCAKQGWATATHAGAWLTITVCEPAITLEPQAMQLALRRLPLPLCPNRCGPGPGCGQRVDPLEDHALALAQVCSPDGQRPSSELG